MSFPQGHLGFLSAAHSLRIFIDRVNMHPSAIGFECCVKYMFDISA